MPEKAWRACASVCADGEGEAFACEALARWELKREAKAREAEARAAAEEFAARVTALRGELDACARDPASCERACAREDVARCAWLGDHLLQDGADADAKARGEAALETACRAHDDAVACPLPACADIEEPARCGRLTPTDCPDGQDLKTCVDRCDGQRACDRLLARDCLLDVDGCHAACEAGEAPHCRQLAAMYREGDGVARNSAKAEQFAEQACARGDTWSCARPPTDAPVRKLRARRLAELRGPATAP